MFRKVLYMDDLHLPKQMDVAIDIIKKHSKEVTHICLGGDFLDLGSVSTFTKFSYVSLLEEVKSGYDFLQEVRSITNVPIILFTGNHMARLNRYINNLNDREVVPFINPNVVEWYRDGFTTYEYGERKEYKPIENIITSRDWYVVLDNKLALTHPYSYKKNPYNFGKDICQWFFNNDFEPEMIIVGHTHKVGYLRIAEYKHTPVIGSGCMSKKAKYGKGKVSMTNEQAGYVIVSYDTRNQDKLSIDNVEQFDLGVHMTKINHIEL